MLEYIYSNRRLGNIFTLIDKEYRVLDQIAPLFWTEHCVECAAPACYGTCSRYKQRADGNCIRVVNGITPIEIGGKLGARIEFRTWAKIESQFKCQALSGRKYAKIYKRITLLGNVVHKLCSLIPLKRLQKFIFAGWFSSRQKYINFSLKQKQLYTNLDLCIDLKNEDKATMLLIDVKSSDKLLYRERIEVPLGVSHFDIAIPPYAGADSDDLYLINLHPADAEEHVVLEFQTLELIPRPIVQGKKIKCVIWDLDNTLWDGVLIEDKSVKVNGQFVELIRQLDACGIINSIVSKNDRSEVTTKLKQLGIEDYFVFTKINWDPKSVNVSKIIKQMNINPDTIVFVDDNPFERTEVGQQHPTITCIDPSEMIGFSKCDRFNMVVTEDSKKRRSTYKMLEALKTEEEEWKGNIDDFLLSCCIQVKVFHPADDVVPRCFELIQRTNQLNSSGRRLTMDEVTQIVQNTVNYDAYALRSSDKFGDYGIVGFLIVNKIGKTPCITDFVISCRVANKKIEPTIINYLAKKYGGEVGFAYKKTAKNGPMYKVIEELGMAKSDSVNDVEMYLCRYNESFGKIVELEELS